jgi:hypothetical protein
MFTASGLQVRFLKIIEKSNYQTARAASHTRHRIFVLHERNRHPGATPFS